MNTQILDGVLDTEAWSEVLRQFPDLTSDVYFWPEYIATHRFEPDAKATMFTYQHSGNIWVYPFLLQPIPSIGEHTLDGSWFDIQTPYGYGGPLSSSNDSKFLSHAHKAFTDWCQASGVVAEFVRFHPLMENQRWASPQLERTYDRETLSIGLANLADGNLPFNSAARNMLRRAQQTDIELIVCTPEYDIPKFIPLYARTMDLRSADVFYYFGEEYFRRLGHLVQHNGWLIAAVVDDAWAAAAIFLKGPRWMHYHLAASDPDKHFPGIMNQLLYTASEMGLQAGLQVMHLGGGRTTMQDDSLLKFKRSMATDSHSFYIGKRIHRPDVYASLRKLWQQSFPSLTSKYGQRLLCYRYTS